MGLNENYFQRCCFLEINFLPRGAKGGGIPVKSSPTASTSPKKVPGLSMQGISTLFKRSPRQLNSIAENNHSSSANKEAHGGLRRFSPQKRS
jgi:hypothetical protein